MKKKVLSALISVAMVATLLIGCGAKAEEAPAAEAPAATEEAATEEATEEAPAAEEEAPAAEATGPNIVLSPNQGKNRFKCSRASKRRSRKGCPNASK